MAAITAALIGAAVAAGTTLYARHEQRESRIDANKQQAKARQGVEDAKAQQDATMTARAARARQLSMASGGYESTIATSPLGLSGGDTGKTQLGA